MARKKSADDNKKRLVILDSHAILHRAYHAIPDFSTSKGEPTGALYGLTTTLLKAVDDLRPDYILAARDLPGKTDRHTLFEEYKGTRAPTDEELKVQLAKAPEVFKAFGIPVYSSPGQEADDVIGTIVKKFSKRKDLTTIIVSGDLDTLQLVSENVKVYTMRKGIADTILYDVDMVHERYGFGPEFVTDLKGIRGDPSDNIKGVPGVGEDSALKLIKTFGHVEDIIKTIKKNGAEQVAKDAGVRTRYVELVAQHAEDARFSKQLATINCDVKIDIELPPVWELDAHADSIIKLCEELEFRSIRERVRAAVAGAKENPSVEPTQQEVDPLAFRETSVALWLLHSDTANPSLEDILNYTGDDDFEKARKKIFDELRTTGRLQQVFDAIECPLIPVVTRMNEDGVAIDVAALKALSKEYSKELGAIAGRIFAHAGHEFNINSPRQLGSVLYDELKVVPERMKKTAGGARTTRESQLQELATMHPIIGEILAYRELQKLLSTYIDKMPALVGEDGRLRAEFLQAGAATGRMASQDPNLQNIPVKSEYGRRIREAFAAPRGRVLVALDYSQIELRIAAGLSGDEKLVDIFKRGGDVHAAVAAEVFNVPPNKVDKEMRRRAKVINFGILYGMGVNALRANLGESVSRAEAGAFLEKYFKDFSGLAHYIETTKADAARLGYTETLFGRRRYFSGFKSALPNLRAQAERMATNAPMQGTQADIIKLAMVEADGLIEKKGWRDSARLVLQVHDELVYEFETKIADEAAAMIQRVMEEVVDPKKLSGVPIVAEASLGKNWGAMERIKR